MADHVLWARLPPSTVLGALLAACGEICAQFSAGCADPWAEVADCFVPDAVFVHPGGRVEGSSGIVARAQAALGPLDASQHLLGSILVRSTATPRRPTRPTVAPVRPEAIST